MTDPRRLERSLASHDNAITVGLVRSAWVDIAEARDHLHTICRPNVPDTELHWVDEALAQLSQATCRLEMAVEIHD